MRTYGLTGGIGSGKSTVARLLAEQGASIVDADEVARDVVVPGSVGLARIVDAFGAVLDEHGALDRRLLGERVFADDQARMTLNAILHPLIAAESAARLSVLRERGVPVAIYEAALLVENGASRAFDGLIVVEASAAQQQARVVARDGLAVDEARRRIVAQTSNEARRAAATFVIVNDGSLDQLREKVRTLYEALSPKSAG